MIANFKKLSEIYIDHLWLQFSTEAQDMAWSEARQYSNQVSRWTAYLNLLVLNSFVPYLRENINSDRLSLEIMFSDRISQFQTWKSDLWEFFNGTAIQLGDIRLVIIPDDRAIADELSIVKEWVDIPQFAADYYLGVQVDLEERWVRVWGYVTHQQIKEKAEYDGWDRTYLLDADNAIADLNILWMARELGIQERGEYELTDLPSLTSSQQTNLIEKWGQPSAYSPRLVVTDEEFRLWGALLCDDSGREALYRQRADLPKAVKSVPVAETIMLESDLSPTSSESVGMMHRIRNTLESICQQVEPVLKRSQGEIIPGYLNNPQTVRGYKGTNPVMVSLPDRSQEIALTVAFIPAKYQLEMIDIIIEVRPLDENQSLLPNLELKALNLEKVTIAGIQAETGKSRMLCKFSRKLQEPFRIQLKLDNWEYGQNYSSIQNQQYLI